MNVTVSDILFSAAVQIRGQLTKAGRNIQHGRDGGVIVSIDAALRSEICTVVDEMERLARRLLTETIDPFVVRQ